MLGGIWRNRRPGDGPSQRQPVAPHLAADPDAERAITHAYRMGSAALAAEQACRGQRLIDRTLAMSTRRRGTAKGVAPDPPRPAGRRCRLVNPKE
jgi:hypothetical protein